MSPKDDREKPKVKDRTVNRRNILLGGTTLAAASALGSGTIQVAQAQAQPAAPSGRKPNIITIFGDDVGVWNISAFNIVVTPLGGMLDSGSAPRSTISTPSGRAMNAV